MKKILKKILLFSLLLLPFATSYTNAAIWDAPSYYDNFSKYFTSGMPDENWEIVDVYNIDWISSEKSFQENIRCLFYPNSYNVPWCSSVSRWWSIRDLLKYVWYAIVVLFIIIAWANLLISWSSPDKVKSSLSSLLYIILWAILFFDRSEFCDQYYSWKQQDEQLDCPRASMEIKDLCFSLYYHLQKLLHL